MHKDSHMIPYQTGICPICDTETDQTISRPFLTRYPDNKPGMYSIPICYQCNNVINTKLNGTIHFDLTKAYIADGMELPPDVPPDVPPDDTDDTDSVIGLFDW